MRKFLAIKLALVLLLTSLSYPGIAKEKNVECENGECVPALIDKLEDLGHSYQTECLPSEGAKNLSKYHQENGLTERCWQLTTEINHLEAELQKYQTFLEERLNCQDGKCQEALQVVKPEDEIFLSKVEKTLSCTEVKIQEINQQCTRDIGCVLANSAPIIGDDLARLLDSKSKMKGCYSNQDGCLTQLATSFLNSTMSFFSASWEFLKLANKKVSQKMTDFWDRVSKAEDHSSTSQLALAKASEDPGLFDKLLTDFPGTVTQIWEVFVDSLSVWLKTDIFCQKWSGVPHLSNCLKPTEGLDCIPCRTMLTGLCSAGGTLFTEVIPAFLTGGLVTALKHGAKGAAKISKLYKISDASIATLKNSKISKLARETSGKIVPKSVRATMEASLQAIRTYLMSPLRKVLKESHLALIGLAKKGAVYLAKGPAGKLVVFSAQTVRSSGKLILYPVINPLTTFSYHAGQRSFEKLLKLGPPQLVFPSPAASALLSHQGQLQSLLAKIEEVSLSKGNRAELPKLQEELLSRIEPGRSKIVNKVLLDSDVEFNDLLRNLYPELQYGGLASKLPPEKILASENQLLEAIVAMPEGAAKEKLLKRFHEHLKGEARARVISK